MHSLTAVVVMLLVAPRLQRLPLTVTQWLHASYALGGVTGAAIAGPLLAGDLDFRWGLAIAGARRRRSRSRPCSARRRCESPRSRCSSPSSSRARWTPGRALDLREVLDLRAAMAVVVVATLGIIVAGLLAPRSRV